MSLISEALKKARLESGDRKERLPYVTRPMPPKRRAPLWPWLVASISLSLAGGIVVGVLLLRVGGPEPVSSPSSRSSTGITPDTSLERPSADLGTRRSSGSSEPGMKDGRPAEDLPGRGDLSTGPETRETDDPGESMNSEGDSLGSVDRSDVTVAENESSMTVSEEIAAGPQRTDPRVESADLRTNSPAGTGTISARSPAPRSRGTMGEPGTREAEPARPGPEPGSSHDRRVVLPDGSEIVLGGIALSDGTAAVLINGDVLAPGDSREGWRLVRAERGRVEIEWEGIRFFLEL